MTNRQQKLVELREKLYTGDAMRRNLACDEMWALINEIQDDPNNVELLMSEMIDVLADLGRNEDWQRCFNRLYASNDYRLQIRALGAKAWKCKKTTPVDVQCMQEAYEEAIHISKEHDDNERAAECSMMLAKLWLTMADKRNEALEAQGYRVVRFRNEEVVEGLTPGPSPSREGSGVEWVRERIMASLPSPLPIQGKGC